MAVTYRNLGQVGRIGNSLFQLASTIGIARAHDDEPSFPAWDYQPYFSVPEEFFTSEPGTEAIEFATHIDERARIYLQDYNLFAEIADEIRGYFQPSELALKTLNEVDQFNDLAHPILSVHVRRGDNVQANDPRTPDKHLYHPLRSLDYYQRAIESLQGEYASVAAFSDDPEWTRAHIDADYYYEGVPRAKEFESRYHIDPILDWIDLFLMARADFHVISNSTYGWWGAFLSGDPAPIYPSNWFGPALSHIDWHLMMPSGWVEIEDATDAP